MSGAVVLVLLVVPGAITGLGTYALARRFAISPAIASVVVVTLWLLLPTAVAYATWQPEGSPTTDFLLRRTGHALFWLFVGMCNAATALATFGITGRLTAPLRRGADTRS